MPDGTPTGENQGPFAHHRSSATKRLGSQAARDDAATPGYRSALASATAAPPPQSRRRPIGRWLVGGLFVAVMVLSARAAWSLFFHFPAQGVVTGRVISLSAPWDGTIGQWCVREGDSVREGEVLATLHNLGLEQGMARVGDECCSAQATLQAEMSQLAWQARRDVDAQRKAEAEYYETWGELLQQQARQQDLEARLARCQAANQRYTSAVAAEEISGLQFELDGVRGKVEKLTLALGELKQRVAVSRWTNDDGNHRLKPHLARIETLRAELLRLREQLNQGQLRSPVNGRVVKLHVFSGEHAQTGETIVEVIADGSLRAVLYLSQAQSEALRSGGQVEVRIKPHAETQKFRVLRCGEQMEPPPASLQHYYRKDERLLPVHLEPLDEGQIPFRLRCGSEIEWVP